jgi:DnaK suppressor protein
MPRTKLKANKWEPLKEALLHKQAEMMETYARDRAAGNEQPQDGIQDLADKAANAYSKELNFSLSDADRETLMLIQEAIERFAANEYGTCVHCGTEIGLKRLEAVPWAPYCIDCQELDERGML